MWKKLSDVVKTMGGYNDADIFTNLNPDFPYDPAYGLPDDFRFRVLEYADAVGIKRASERYNVATSTIYKWSAALRKGVK